MSTITSHSNDSTNGTTHIKDAPLVQAKPFDFELLFNAYLDEIYLPLSNIVFPYGNFSDAFNNALMEYLSEDFQAFQQKLASFAQGKDNSPDFMNASYEELLNTPVDEGDEAANSTSQAASSSEVNSQSNNLSNFDSSGLSTAGLEVLDKNKMITTVSPNSAEGAPVFFASIHAPNESYIVNVSQPGGLIVPSTTPLTYDPDALIRILELGNAFSLLGARLVVDNGGLSRILVAIDGISIPVDGTIILGNGYIASANANGGFTYIPIQGNPPFADGFDFTLMDKAGHLLPGHAYISEIQNPSFYLPLTFDNYTDTFSTVLSANLLTGDAPAPTATLSVAFVLDPGANGNFPNVIFSEFTSSSLNFSFTDNGDNMSVTVSKNGDVTISGSGSSIPDPFDLLFVVSDGLGNTALADATITPTVKPVILDLVGQGIQLTAAQNSPETIGMLTSTNNPTHVGWYGAGEGMLMYDPNNSGKLTNLNQISFVSYTNGAQTDLGGLVAFDTNHNGMLDNNDKDFSKFGVLFSNGKFETLSQLGIVSISLSSDHNSLDQNGNHIYGLTSYLTSDGESHTAADVALGIALSSNNTSLTLQDVIHDVPQGTSAALAAAQAGVNTLLTVTQTAEHLMPTTNEAAHLA
ncbi:MAG: hypothetical protein JSR17_04645 [Proteobacteria bacterium]|nr:hypothetical protein [Pseudomonadota bacterium]